MLNIISNFTFKSLSDMRPQEGFYLDDSGKHIIFRNMGGRTIPIEVTAEEYAEMMLGEYGIPIDPADQATLNEIEYTLEYLEQMAEMNPAAAANAEKEMIAQRQQLYNVANPYFQQAMQQEAEKQELSVEDVVSERKEMFELYKDEVVRRRDLENRGWSSDIIDYVDDVIEFNEVSPGTDDWMVLQGMGVLLDRAIKNAKAGDAKATLESVLSDEIESGMSHLSTLTKEGRFDKFREGEGRTGFDVNMMRGLMQLKHNVENATEAAVALSEIFDEKYGKIQRDFDRTTVKYDPISTLRTRVSATPDMVADTLPEQIDPRELSKLNDSSLLKEYRGSERATRHLLTRIWTGIPKEQQGAAIQNLTNAKNGVEIQHRDGWNEAYNQVKERGIRGSVETLGKEIILLASSINSRSTLEDRTDTIRAISYKMGMMDGINRLSMDNPREVGSARAFAGVRDKIRSGKGSNIVDMLLHEDPESNLLSNKGFFLLPRAPETTKQGAPVTSYSESVTNNVYQSEQGVTVTSPAEGGEVPSEGYIVDVETKVANLADDKDVKAAIAWAQDRAKEIPGAIVKTTKSPGNERVTVSVGAVVDDENEAKSVGRKQSRRTVYNLSTGEDIAVGGNFGFTQTGFGFKHDSGYELRFVNPEKGWNLVGPSGNVEGTFRLKPVGREEATEQLQRTLSNVDTYISKLTNPELTTPTPEPAPDTTPIPTPTKREGDSVEDNLAYMSSVPSFSQPLNPDSADLMQSIGRKAYAAGVVAKETSAFSMEFPNGAKLLRGANGGLVAVLPGSNTPEAMTADLIDQLVTTPGPAEEEPAPKEESPKEEVDFFANVNQFEKKHSTLFGNLDKDTKMSTELMLREIIRSNPVPIEEEADGNVLNINDEIRIRAGSHGGITAQFKGKTGNWGAVTNVTDSIEDRIFDRIREATPVENLSTLIEEKYTGSNAPTYSERVEVGRRLDESEGNHIHYATNGLPYLNMPKRSLKEDVPGLSTPPLKGESSDLLKNLNRLLDVGNIGYGTRNGGNTLNVGGILITNNKGNLEVSTPGSGGMSEPEPLTEERIRQIYDELISPERRKAVEEYEKVSHEAHARLGESSKSFVSKSQKNHNFIAGLRL